MKSICGWCDTVLDPGTGEENEEISHGMCAVCGFKLRMSMTLDKMGAVTKEERDALLDFDRR